MTAIQRHAACSLPTLAPLRWLALVLRETKRMIDDNANQGLGNTSLQGYRVQNQRGGPADRVKED